MSLTQHDIQQIKEVVDTAIYPLAAKFDVLDTKVDALANRHDVLEDKIDSFRTMFEEDIFAEAGRVDKIDLRLTKVEGRLDRHLL